MNRNSGCVDDLVIEPGCVALFIIEEPLVIK